MAIPPLFCLFLILLCYSCLLHPFFIALCFYLTFLTPICLFGGEENEGFEMNLVFSFCLFLHSRILVLIPTFSFFFILLSLLLFLLTLHQLHYKHIYPSSSIMKILFLSLGLAAIALASAQKGKNYKRLAFSTWRFSFLEHHVHLLVYHPRARQLFS